MRSVSYSGRKDNLLSLMEEWRAAPAPTNQHFSPFDSLMKSNWEKSWLIWVACALPCSAFIHSNILKWMNGAAAGKKRKTISSLLLWWAPQPIKKREIAFSSFNQLNSINQQRQTIPSISQLIFSIINWLNEKMNCWLISFLFFCWVWFELDCWLIVKES